MNRPTSRASRRHFASRTFILTFIAASTSSAASSTPSGA